MLNDLPKITDSILTQPTEVIDQLSLDLTDDQIIDARTSNVLASKNFYKQRGLAEKQEKNLKYYLGQQEVYKASTKSKTYRENIVYEGLSRQKPIELSRLPDMTVKPGGETPEHKKTAEMITEVVNSDIKKRKNRKLLGLAIKQEPLYYYAVIKALWNPEIGMFGDYEFVNVNPTKITWDHLAPDNDANSMKIVDEALETSLKELIAMFPTKEDEIKAAYGWTSDANSDKSDDAKMSSPVVVYETWFHSYKIKDGETERIDGVSWIYKTLVLEKMKNPYFDYQGRKKTFSMVMKEKQGSTVDEILGMFDVENETDEQDNDIIYNNYFQDPEKPYFFMVYENMGLQPIGETSRIEQVLDLQDSLNQSGAVIQDMNIRSRGKDIFDTNAIDQTTLDSVNIYDIDQVLGLDVPQGQSINNVHSRIEQQPATQQQYRSQDTDRQKGFEIIGVGATTRGIQEPDSTLGESQMAREADYGVIDDIVEDTINACAEWQARWAMQFIKLFYTVPHMRHLLGKDGETLHARVNQDMVDDGMEAVVSASGVDKMMRKRMAMENAKIGYGNPLDYFQDTEQSNPKERALRAMLFAVAPQMYIQKYLIDDQGDPNTPATNQVLGKDQPPMPGDQQPVNNQPPVPPVI